MSETSAYFTEIESQTQNIPSTSHGMTSSIRTPGRNEEFRMGGTNKGNLSQRERLELRELKNKGGPVFDSFE